MRCPSCNYDNPADALFCEGCGAKLELICPACKASVTPGARFCKKCGTAIAPTKPAASTTVSSPRSQVIVAADGAAAASETIDGERKTVTALFADIKGSTELMEDLDPEEARTIIDPALKLMIDAVRRYDGYVVQSTGDGIFAMFGAPVAHEDHPQRALYTALRMQEEVRRYADRQRAEGRAPIQIRVGVNTGEVVVRSITTGAGQVEYTPIGHTANLASRMQTLANPGSTVIAESTRRLVEGYFALKPLGASRVKGGAEPVNVYEVTGLGPLRTRLQRSAGRGLTKFVGREREIEAMKHAAEQAQAGHGQIVAAMGEPGVGKSRLFFEFKAVAQSGCLVLEAYSVSHGKASAYLPVIDLLKSYFEIMPEDDERKRREKVAGKVVILDRTLEDTLPFLYSLLGISESDDPLAALDPQTRRRRTLEAIKRILVRESLNQPLIVEFEDLHWIDSETQALLNLLVDCIATARILLLVNYRPEYHHQWGSKTYYSQLRLDPLGKESADEMLSALLASPAPAALSAGANRERPTVRSEAEDGRVRVGLPLPDQGEGRGVGIAPLKRLIIERTEGNPFFMEEMVQALFEQGVLTRNGAAKLVRPLNEIRVPPTVQAILASRIDRLPAAEKELLQTLAVLGREFSSRLIKQVVGKSDDELERMLAALQLAEFIYEQPATGDVEYTFKHALTLEVAYNSVLVERRRLLHERAARAIEALFSDRLEDHLSELAHHYDRSGNVRKAVEYLGLAGVRAAEQMAHSEAVGHLTRALELLKLLPNSVDRNRQELPLQMALSRSLYVTAGPLAPERDTVLLRARGLGEKLADNSNLTEVLMALSFVRLLQRELGIARELAESALAMAEQDKSAAMLPKAHFQLGNVLNISGQFEAAREHFEHAPATVSGQFRGSGQLAHVLFTLGYPEAALRQSRESLSVAHGLSDPVSIVTALSSEALLHVRLRDIRAVMERAEQAISIATEHGIPFLLIQSTFLRGWALAVAGRREGIAEMRRSVSDLAALGVRLSPNFVMLAEACGKNRLQKEGLATVAEGLAMAELTGVRYFESSLHRLQGELLLMDDPSNVSEAERCFRTAIDVARRQRARWWELLATISLARLLKNQGKSGEARAMLAEIYGWFTEGFEFADLRDAKALLDEMSN